MRRATLPAVVGGQVRNRISGEGMAGVLVSNGEQVAPSGPDGSYVLKAGPEHTLVWVVVPDGFAAAGPFYAHTRSTGDSADFELAPAPPPGSGRLKVVQVSDFHLGETGGKGPGRDDLTADLLQIGAREAPDLIVVSGDLTHAGSHEQLRLCRSAFEALDIPVLPFFGGHDGREERQVSGPGATWTRNYEEVFGPPYYSFDRGGRHWILYANEEGCFSPADRKRKSAWLRNDLEMQPAPKEIVVLVHATPSLDFIEELSRFQVRILLHGHRHANKVYLHRGIEVASTPPLCFGGTDTSARGYRVLDFAPGSATRYRALQHPLAEEPRPSARALPQPELRRVWEYRLPGGLHRAAPVCKGGRVVASSGDGSPGSGTGLHCLEAESGRLLWHSRTDSAVKGSAALDDAGHCAAVSVAGRLFVLDARSGACRWTADLPGYPERWIYSSPAIWGGAVYAGSNAGYGAYDLETGDLRWYTSFVGDAIRIIDKPSHSSAVVWQNRLIAALPKRGILGMHLDSGGVAWELEAGLAPHCCSPVPHVDMVLCPGQNGELIAVEAESGRPVWRRALPSEGFPTGLAVAENKIYVATSAGEVHCLDRRSGKAEWTFAGGEDLVDMVPKGRGGRSFLAAPLVWRKWVVVCGNDGFASMLDPGSGKCLDRTPMGAPVSADPCQAGDGLCIGTWDGRLLYLCG